MDNIEKKEPIPEETSKIKDSDALVDEVLAGKKKSKFKWALLGIIAVIVIAAIGIVFIIGNIIEDKDVSVALVNDESISQTDFDSFYAQQVSTFQSQGLDLNDPEQLKEAQSQALETLINQRLLLQAASDAGIAVTDEEIQSEYDMTVGQFESPEAFQTALSDNNLTEASFKDRIDIELTIQNYLATQVDNDVAVSDEEIQALYDQYVEQGSNIPALAEVTTQLSDQIKQQKINAQVSTIIDTLKQSATIQTFLE